METLENKPTTGKALVEAEGFDIGVFDTKTACNDGAEFELKHPVTGAKTGVFWSVLGTDSDVFQSIVKDRSDEDSRKAAMAARSGEELPTRTADQIEARNVELLAAVSTGWRTVIGKGDEAKSEPVLIFKGERLSFTVPNVTRVLREMAQIRKQVDKAVGDLSLFIKA